MYSLFLLVVFASKQKYEKTPDFFSKELQLQLVCSIFRQSKRVFNDLLLKQHLIGWHKNQIRKELFVLWRYACWQ